MTCPAKQQRTAYRPSGRTRPAKRTPATHRRVFAQVALCAALAGCAVPVPMRETSNAGEIVVEAVSLDARPFAAHWALPPAKPPALVVLAHGFTRRCANLRETLRQMMAGGLMVLCVDAPMADGNPALADALARHLAGGAVAPEGRAVPRSVVVAGHSAGAAFALALGARLEAVAPGRLAGALLFDPVAPAASTSPAGAGDFEATLRAVSAAGRRPVLALLAPPHRCNARSNALPALRRAEQAALEDGSSAFVIVHLPEGATHADVEGEDTDALARWACGTIDPAHTAALRARALAWLHAAVPSLGAPAPPPAP